MSSSILSSLPHARAEANAKLEVMLGQIRAHDPSLITVVCHHGKREDGHVGYADRWNMGDLGAARIATAVSGTGNSLGPNMIVKVYYP